MIIDFISLRKSCHLSHAADDRFSLPQLLKLREGKPKIIEAYLKKKSKEKKYEKMETLSPQ